MIAAAVGVIGYCSTRYHKKPLSTPLGYIAQAARNAVLHAGIAKHEIDGLAVDGSLGADTSVSAAEHLGLTVSWVHRSAAAVAGTIMLVAHVVRAVEAGLAQCVLCVGVGAQDISSFKQRLSSFTAAVANYRAPHGYGGPSGMHALIQRKHMAAFGTTREQFGRIFVDRRINAGRNEAALLRKPLSLDEYLNAKLIADPLRLYECMLPCSGAEALAVGAPDRVPHGKGVRILSARECHKHRPQEAVPLSGGWEAFRERLFDEAGRSHADMDFVQCYDDFPIVAALQIEDPGVCPKGEVGRFLANHRLTHDGSFPLNTGGGQPSCGQAGSRAALMGLVEAVRQLRGEAGDRQVPLRTARSAFSCPPAFNVSAPAPGQRRQCAKMSTLPELLANVGIGRETEIAGQLPSGGLASDNCPSSLQARPRAQASLHALDGSQGGLIEYPSVRNSV